MSDPLRLIADVHISPFTLQVLKERGWDVFRVPERLHPRASDWEILELARQEGRAVLTQDLDFSYLLAVSGFSEPSLVTLRLSESDPFLIADRLLEAEPEIRDKLGDGWAITIEDRAIRFRKLPIRRGRRH